MIKTPILLFAFLTIYLLQTIPVFDQFVYPLRLFVTFVHEGCHGFAAIITGGKLHSIVINADMSGSAFTSGGNNLIISSAGYLGSILMGLVYIQAIKIKIPNPLILLHMSIIVLFNMFNMGFSNSFGTSMGIVLLFIFCAGMVVQTISTLLVSLFAVQVLLGAFYDLQTLFVATTTSNIHSDAQNMQSYTGIPAIFWAIFWIGLSIFSTFYVLFGEKWNLKNRRV